MGNIIPPRAVTVSGVKMPKYYMPKPSFTEDDISRIKSSWALLMENRSVEFETKRRNGEMQYDSCFAWFYTSFYDRLFEVYPQCRQLFKSDIHVQGRALVRMITTCLQYMQSPEKFNEALKELAIRHVSRGVNPEDYFVVGEVLVWTLENCLKSQFDDQSKCAWLKVYSRMLEEIIPATVLEIDKSKISSTNNTSAVTSAQPVLVQVGSQ